MDSELTELVEKAVSNGLTSASWIVILIGLVAAATGAFLGSYFKRKGELVATKEDFEELLKQLKDQTRATEAIKADIQRDLTTFRDTLERDREFAGFRRERIAEHLNVVLNAYVELYAIAQLIPLRLWIYSNSDLETEGRFHSALSQLRTHFGALDCMGVLPEEVSKEFTDKNWRVLNSWKDVLGEAARRTPEFRKEHPDDLQFSSEQYNEQWIKFMDTIENLGVVIKGLSHDIFLPPVDRRSSRSLLGGHNT